MIVVDTSALIAVVLEEPQAEVCLEAISLGGRLLISAVVATEARIVASRRGVGPAMALLLDELDMDVVSIDEEGSLMAAAAYARWGKGVDPAALNIIDMFSYALAKANDCPLLYIGNDFARTDIRSALKI
ncbi:MAG: twitching motility protein PilT [Caulobacteraceae bacterium]|nr:twitching motility protein PilT [Caulobacteraceae bacterium]